jgi:hypothetical protein
MKLSKYIHGKMGPENAITWRAHTEDDLEEWIISWYEGVYERKPPMWLAGKDWAKREKERVARKKGEE